MYINLKFLEKILYDSIMFLSVYVININLNEKGNAFSILYYKVF